MIYEFTVNSTELSFTKNDDGLHVLRVVQAGENPLEFICVVRPYLTVTVDIDSDAILRNHAGHVIVEGDRKILLTVAGMLQRNPDGTDWVSRVLDERDKRREGC